MFHPSAVPPTETSPESESTHVHRWRIAEQAGANSAGRCDCGTEREFQNGWEGDTAIQLRPKSWVARRDTRGAAGR